MGFHTAFHSSKANKMSPFFKFSMVSCHHRRKRELFIVSDLEEFLIQKSDYWVINPLNINDIYINVNVIHVSFFFNL